MTSFISDYKFGMLGEEKVYDKIKNYFGNDIIKTNKYCKYDFYNDEFLFEVKSRKIKYKDFTTTIIPEDKIIPECKPKKQIFIFNFLDGVYYIEYKEETFKNFTLQEYKRNDRCDYNDIKKLYYFIPITELIKI